MFTYYRYTDKFNLNPSNPYRYCKIDQAGHMYKDLGEASDLCNTYGELGRELVVWKLQGMDWVRISRMQFAEEAGFACVDYGDDISDVFDPTKEEPEEYAPLTRHEVPGRIKLTIARSVIDLTPAGYTVFRMDETHRDELHSYLVGEGASHRQAKDYLQTFFSDTGYRGWIVKNEQERTGVILAKWSPSRPNEVCIDYMRTSSNRVLYLLLSTLKESVTEDMQLRENPLSRQVLKIPFVPAFMDETGTSKVQTYKRQVWSNMIDQYALQARRDEVAAQGVQD